MFSVSKPSKYIKLKIRFKVNIVVGFFTTTLQFRTRGTLYIRKIREYILFVAINNS